MTRIGLISDTHMPARCDALPPTVFEALRGVDLVLHAGDVGELWVLDQLSAIAPVIAVYGNDETVDAQRELPYQQLVVVGGQRILLTHAHYPDRAEELESRKDDAWEPKLSRRAAMGQRAGASVVVFGHTHIPMIKEHDGVLLVNPGALGPPNLTTRQSVRTVAILTLPDGGTPVVRHISLDAPDIPLAFPIDWDAGFRATLLRVQEPIVAPEIAALMPRLYALMERAEGRSLFAVYERLARACWSGGRDVITDDDLRTMADDPALPAATKTALLDALNGSRP